MSDSLIFCGAIVLIFLAGCAASYDQSTVLETTAKLDSSEKVLVSIPENGVYGNDTYRNSGRQTANAVRTAFSKLGVTTDVTERCHGLNCLELEGIDRYGYYVQPVILHWEDRATEWSGKSDRLEVQLIVYDVASSEELVNVTYSGKSQWLTFGGDHPQDLLAAPTEELVSSLY